MVQDIPAVAGHDPAGAQALRAHRGHRLPSQRYVLQDPGIPVVAMILNNFIEILLIKVSGVKKIPFLYFFYTGILLAGDRGGGVPNLKQFRPAYFTSLDMTVEPCDQITPQLSSNSDTSEPQYANLDER